jgi:hypothetical protein
MAASMQEYVVRVRRTPEGEYRATVREVAPGVPLDVRTVPTGAAGIGAAATQPAAILSAVIAARIPDLSGDLTRA